MRRRLPHVSVVLTMLAMVLLAGCRQERPVKGFVLPPGDAERGREVFIAQACYQCHSIPGVELPARASEPPFVVELGGKVQRVKDYGELLTAVVYPDHVISPRYRNLLMQAGEDPNMSPMPYFADTLTVTELTHLVEFLHGQYERLLPTYYKSHYPAVR
jgi:L-cysteine S-thiosulfotransferase